MDADHNVHAGPGTLTAAATPWEAADDELLAAATARVGQIPDEAGPGVHQAGSRRWGRDLESFRTEVEQAFNDTMARASGWYKRKAQLMVLFIALGVTVSLQRGHRESGHAPLERRATPDDDRHGGGQGGQRNPGRTTGASGPTGRARTSGAVAGTPGATGPTGPTGAPACRPCLVRREPASAQGCIQYQADRAGKALDQVDALKLPIGWAAPTGRSPARACVHTRLALTMIALSLGAPFWFDLLNKLVRLRSTGVPENPDTSGSVGQSAPATASSSSVGAAEPAQGCGTARHQAQVARIDQTRGARGRGHAPRVALQLLGHPRKQGAVLGDVLGAVGAHLCEARPGRYVVGVRREPVGEARQRRTCSRSTPDGVRMCSL